MKPSRAANVGLCLLAVGWPCLVYGALSQLGDPAPWVTESQIKAHFRVSLSVALIGVVTLLCAVALAGYAFASAKKRSTLVLVSVIVPVVLLFAANLRS